MASYPNTKLKTLAYLVIVVHLMLVVAHAAAHQTLEVDPTPLQLSFIIAIIMIAPMIAGLLLHKYGRAGSALMILSMAGAFLFGVYNHFVGHSIDHVAEVANLRPVIWSTVFQWSAVGLAVTEAAGTAIGALLLVDRGPELETHAA